MKTGYCKKCGSRLLKEIKDDAFFVYKNGQVVKIRGTLEKRIYEIKCICGAGVEVVGYRRQLADERVVEGIPVKNVPEKLMFITVNWEFSKNIIWK